MLTLRPSRRHLTGQRLSPTTSENKMWDCEGRGPAPQIIILSAMHEIRWQDLCVLWLHPAEQMWAAPGSTALAGASRCWSTGAQVPPTAVTSQQPQLCTLGEFGS